ncbi:MAG: hypothetical protein H0X30_19775 [Anaerolineae bacterium]|nr:hypothetical protein [Anaerolineae bacterium]
MTEKPKPDINLDRFEQWHEIVSDNIQHFFSTTPESISTKLDYSMDSLNVLGKWLIEQYPYPDPSSEKKQNGQIGIHNGLSYYVGEVYRKYLEGHWNVHFKELEPDYEYGEEPVIEGFHHDVALCPYKVVLLTLLRNDGETLKKILIDYMQLYKSKRKM